MYSLYSVLVLAIAVLASPWFVYQALRHKKYVASLGPRMGYLPVSFNMDGDDSIWVHAVSVGEVLTARPLISDLKRRYPELRLFLEGSEPPPPALRLGAAAAEEGGSHG